MRALISFCASSVVSNASRPWSSRYNKLCGSLRSYAHRLSLLPAQDPFRSKMEGQLLAKLYDMGVLNTSAKLSDIENKLTVAAFCRRRLAVIMCMSKMAETVSAVRLVVSPMPARIFQIEDRSPSPRTQRYTMSGIHLTAPSNDGMCGMLPHV